MKRLSQAEIEAATREELLEAAVQNCGPPDDVREWARKCAADWELADRVEHSQQLEGGAIGQSNQLNRPSIDSRK